MRTGHVLYLANVNQLINCNKSQRLKFRNVCWPYSRPGLTHLRGDGVILHRSFEEGVSIHDLCMHFRSPGVGAYPLPVH
jgi:hypothetical protein